MEKIKDNPQLTAHPPVTVKNIFSGQDKGKNRETLQSKAFTVNSGMGFGTDLEWEKAEKNSLPIPYLTAFFVGR